MGSVARATRHLRLLVCAAIVAAPVGCSEPLDVTDDPTVIQVEVSLDSSSVRSGDTLTVRVTATNTTDRSVRVRLLACSRGLNFEVRAENGEVVRHARADCLFPPAAPSFNDATLDFGPGQVRTVRVTNESGGGLTVPSLGSCRFEVWVEQGRGGDRRADPLPGGGAEGRGRARRPARADRLVACVGSGRLHGTGAVRGAGSPAGSGCEVTRSGRAAAGIDRSPIFRSASSAPQGCRYDGIVSGVRRPDPLDTIPGRPYPISERRSRVEGRISAPQVEGLGSTGHVPARAGGVMPVADDG